MAQDQNRPNVQFNAPGAEGAKGTQSANTPRPSNQASAPVANKAAAAKAKKPGTPDSKDPKEGQKKRTLLIVILCVIVAIVIWVLIWLFACNGLGLWDNQARDGQAPYKTAEEMQAELDRIVEEGMFNISIASAIEFEDGTSSGTAYIENVPGNNYNMQVTITNDDTGEVMYESGILKPNQYIENITLAKDYDPGTYSTTATFAALDTTTQEEIGRAAAKVQITVKG